jgi:hypothetical protein
MLTNIDSVVLEFGHKKMMCGATECITVVYIFEDFLPILWFIPQVQITSPSITAATQLQLLTSFKSHLTRNTSSKELEWPANVS